MLDDLASEKQKKMFFALCNDLGHDAETAKERAKKKFNLEHFGEITKHQLSKLIDLLLVQQEMREKKI